MKPSIYKIFLTAVLIISSPAITLAQTSTKISGSLVNSQGAPMDYASVSLLRTKDSTVVMGTLSTEAGLYTFDHIKAGSYIVKAEAVGYTKTLSQPLTITDGTATHTVPALKLTAANRTLNTVSITAAKPLIEHQADKVVMNVAGSVLAAGNTAMDILERAPGVTVDKDDNISLKGKQGVTVMINDKLTYLSSQQLATLLKSTDGNTIQSIEIISNPSAKYDAAGNSGIINIKLKKNSQSGTNGSIITTGGFGAYGNDNSTLTLKP
jgi:iron complex outermembrane receptor protein